MLFVLLLFFCSAFIATSVMLSKRSEDDYRIRISEAAVNNVVSTMQFNIENYNFISRLIMVDADVVNFLRAKEGNKHLTYEAQMGVSKILNMYNNISYVESVYIFKKDGTFSTTGHGEYTVNMEVEETQNILNAKGSRVLAIDGNGMMKKDDKPMMTLSRAIYDLNTQKLLGILVINISNNVFDNVLALQKSCNMCIVDRFGTVLTGDPEIGALYDSECDYEEMAFRTVRLNGERSTITGMKAADPFVVLCATHGESQTIPEDTMYALLLILTAFVLSTMVCAGFITVNIARPIRNLGEAMERTRSSGWLKRIDDDMPNNEIGRLAESYNSMIDYLNELFDRLLQEEKNIQKAEMRVLQEQIKPHFLYNTLETISYIAVQEEAPRVHDALETLGSFYRNFLSKGDREIPLRRELRITQDYLALQKLRYGEAFTDEYSLDESTLDCMIPKLTLQPLVENCIYHGVRMKGEQCVIRISTKKEGDSLKIIIYDSGVGMTEEQIKNVMEPNKEDNVNMLSGFGMHGTINRIRYYCDSEDVVSIRSEMGEFTEITITIPYEKTEVPDIEGEPLSQLEENTESQE